ncbi:MAG: DNA primase [Treponemataceae bacterium]|nr:DNA primase [Treponemataceae bacterium]
MARISNKTLDEINERVDFPALVNEYTHLERRGSEYWGKCPFHTDKTPSFHIIPDRGMYKCFSCGRGGGVISFFMEVEKLSFWDAVHQLAKREGIEVVYEGNVSTDEIKIQHDKYDDYVNLYNRITDTYKYLLWETDAGKFALDYLKSRGVSREIAEQFKLGYCPPDPNWLKKFLKSKSYSDEFLSQSGLFSKNHPDYALLHDRLMFPIFDRKGNVVGFSGRFLRGDPAKAKTGKYVNTPETEFYKKSEILFGFNFAKDAIRKSRSVVICEGNLDVMAYHQAGVKNAVATCGTALTEKHLKMISGFVDTVFLSFDSDAAGQDATKKQILVCRKMDIPVRVVKLEGGKDPNEILNKMGPQILIDAVDSAILDADFLLSMLASRYDIGTADGKKNASLEFFEYIRVLKSDIQKDASLQQLCQAYNLNPEAVSADFAKSAETQAVRMTSKLEKEEEKPRRNLPVKLNAEIRAMLALVSNMEYFADVRSIVNEDDFEDGLARDMFIALEECYREGSGSTDAFLARCTDDRVKKYVVDSLTSREFEINSQQTMQDSIKLIRKNSLKKKREQLQNRIRQCSGNTLEDKQTVEALLAEIMDIDFELKKN